MNHLLGFWLVLIDKLRWLLWRQNCKGPGYDDIIISSRARKIFLKVVVFMILFIF